MKINKRKLLGWILVSPAIALIMLLYGYLVYNDYKLAIGGLIAFGLFCGVTRGLFILGQESEKE
jgi:hypothetical protein